MFRSVIASVLCAALVCGVANAHPDLGNTIRVKVSAADLATPDGARKLAFRLRVAAWKVCGGDIPQGRLASDFNECRQVAIARAIAPVESPVLARALGLGGESLAQSRR